MCIASSRNKFRIMFIYNVLLFRNWKIAKSCRSLRHPVISSFVTEAVYKLLVSPFLLLSFIYSHNTWLSKKTDDPSDGLFFSKPPTLTYMICSPPSDPSTTRGYYQKHLRRDRCLKPSNNAYTRGTFQRYSSLLHVAVRRSERNVLHSAPCLLLPFSKSRPSITSSLPIF